MSNEEKCKECGHKLEPSIYARLIPEGKSTVKAQDNMVCVNQKCSKSEKRA